MENPIRLNGRRQNKPLESPPAVEDKSVEGRKTGQLYQFRGILKLRLSFSGALLFRVLSAPAKTLKFFLQAVQFLVTQALQIYQAGSSASDAAKQFVKFQMESFCVTVLGVLDQEYH